MFLYSACTKKSSITSITRPPIDSFDTSAIVVPAYPYSDTFKGTSYSDFFYGSTGDSVLTDSACTVYITHIDSATFLFSVLINLQTGYMNIDTTAKIKITNQYDFTARSLIAHTANMSAGPFAITIVKDSVLINWSFIQYTYSPDYAVCHGSYSGKIKNPTH